MEMNEVGTLDIGEQAAELVLRVAAGEAGAEEEIPEFAARSPRHLKEVVLHIALHHDLRELATQLYGQREHVRPAADYSHTVRARTLNLIRWLATTAIAAAVLVLAAVLGLYWYYQPLAAVPGYARSFRLSDGSFLQLNGGSLARAEINGSLRHVKLWTGEALFDVEQDLVHPFTVSAGNAIVHAIGTTFDVHLLASKVTVTVKEGRVELEKHCVSPPNAVAGPAQTGNGTVTLEAGERASVSSDGCVHTRQKLDAAQLDRQLAWSHARLAFRNEPLGNAINQFNRYNRRQLSIRDASIRDVLVPGPGGFDSKDIDSFIAALRLLGVKAVSQQDHRAGNDILLVGSDCQWNGVRCTNR
jgi:transmembrane sensor